jgi:hypothetical protein
LSFIQQRSFPFALLQPAFEGNLNKKIPDDSCFLNIIINLKGVHLLVVFTINRAKDFFYTLFAVSCLGV